MEQLIKLSTGKIITILQDEDVENPRTFMDNLGTMVCFHNTYNLGDEHDYNSIDYNGWEELKQAIIKNENVAVILPLFLYDHSGITMRTTSFRDRWDSGQVGFIYISKEKVRKEYIVKRISPQLRNKIKTYLVGEVETYDQYLRGDVYGYKLEDGEESDSCWGFYGSDIKKNGMLDHMYLTEEEKAEFLKEI